MRRLDPHLNLRTGGQVPGGHQSWFYPADNTGENSSIAELPIAGRVGAPTAESGNSQFL